MTSLDWLVVAFLVLQWLGAALNTLMVGKPRPPITPGVAVAQWVIAMIMTAVYLWVR